MRLALAQMKMDTSIDRNLAMTIQYMERAADILPSRCAGTELTRACGDWWMTIPPLPTGAASRKRRK